MMGGVEPEKILTDKEIADRLRANWLQVREDAITLGWRGYNTNVSLLSYRTWCHFELSHFQTMSERVDIARSKTTVTKL